MCTSDNKWIKKRMKTPICLNSKGNEIITCSSFNVCDASPHSLKDSNANPKMKIMERVGVCFLACSILEVEGRVGVPRWGLKWVINKLIIYMNLHKLNNKLVSAWFKHFWCMDESRAHTDSQDSPRPKLGGSHHLPPYSIICAWPWGLHPNVILFWDSQVKSLEIL
jgi:hypothetical protein